MTMPFNYFQRHFMLNLAILLLFAACFTTCFAACNESETPATLSENTVTDCRDNIDNDDDGYVDCADDECAAMAFCVNPGDTADYSSTGGITGDSSAGAQDSETTGDVGGDTGDGYQDSTDTSDSVVIDEVTLSVDENTAVDELTPDERQDVCADVYDAVEPGLMSVANDVSNFVCTAMGLSTVSAMLSPDVSDAELVAACTLAVTTCESDETYTQDFSESLSEDEFCADAADTFDNCNVPAGEVSDCLVALFNVQFAAFNDYMNQMPNCSELTAEVVTNMNDMDDVSDLENIAAPAICANVEAQCPELMDDFN